MKRNARLALLPIVTLATLVLGRLLFEAEDAAASGRPIALPGDDQDADRGPALLVPEPPGAPSGRRGPLEPALRYQPGQRLAYAVQLGSSTSASFDLGIGPAQAPVLSEGRLQLDGRWILRVLAADVGAASIAARFEAVELHLAIPGAGQGPGELRSALERELAEEVVLSVTSRGEILRLDFPRSMTPGARNLIRLAALSLHVRIPRSGESLEQERDLSGVLHVAYATSPIERTGAGAAAWRITRTNLGYTSIGSKVQSGRAAALQTEEADGAVSAWLGVDGGHYLLVQGEERFALGQGTATADVSWRRSTHFRLEEATHDEGLAAEGSDLLAGLRACREEASPFAAEVAPDPRRGRERELARIAKGRSFSTLLEEIVALEAAGAASAQDLAERTQALAAVLALDERAVAEAIAVLDQRVGTESIRSLVLAVLGMAGTPAAQAALAEFLGDERADPALLSSALIGTMNVDSPGPRLTEAIRRYAERNAGSDGSRDAILALGTAQSRLQDHAPARATRLLEWFLDRYRTPHDPSERIAILEGLGNAGDPAAQSVLLEGTRTEDEELRAAAMTGLRRISTPESTGALARVIATDPSPMVRSRAADALAGHGTPVATEALRRTLLEDTEPTIRALALQGLAPRLSDDAVLDAVSRAAELDPSPALRARAAEILARR